MKTAVISVGKEVLSGKTVNTNLKHIALRFQKIGLEINRSFVIDDLKNEYHKILDYVDEDILVFTGGLGPTIDDITRETILEYYNLETFIDEVELQKINTYFKRMNLSMKNTNDKQARRTKDAIILNNTQGTAPGLMIDVNDKLIVLLPGPPNELIPMLDQVINELKERYNIALFSEGFKLVGTGESYMESKLTDFYSKHPNVNIAPYAGLGEIKYVFTSAVKSDLDQCMDEFYSKYKQFIYGSLEDTLEGVVVTLLKEKKLHVSFAESCTGGLLSGTLLNVSGSSSVYNESFITYSNEAKIKNLNVDKTVLDEFGAVSSECAYQMVKGLHDKTNCDIGISVTGIAGPTGGSEEKPVGLVYFGLYNQGNISTHRFVFNGDRHKVRNRSVIYALNLLRGELLNENRD